ncbi:MAG TPA: lysine--tRNA ligase [Thermoanaerobaculia bacterium]|nr:lysine--tRNA ligase [Thermoanaerobaculia bacterium]
MSELAEQIQNRRRKLAELAAAGVATYPTRFDHDLEPSQVHARFDHRGAEELEAEPVRLRVPGRVTGIRGHGRVHFLDLADGRAKLQLFVRRPRLRPDEQQLLDLLDLGDLVGASGRLMRTRAGELSLEVEGLVLLAKALRPLPEKWHGLTDVETRYRQRYLDLLANPASREVFELRSALVRETRAWLDAQGFLEVETPMMHHLAGGATARPFVTHHNALDVDLFLRIAPELFLKRLLVGGLPKVYEINRNFRNEGISTQHNPEFTMLELYWAWVDYEAVLQLTEELVVHLEERLLGGEGVRWRGEKLDLSRPWPRYTVRGALTRFAGIPPERLESESDLRQELAARHLEPPPAPSYGSLLMTLFEELVEAQLLHPTFVLELPVEVSPLAKQRADDPRFVERFELYVAGMEIANAFSELNDPQAQAARFRQQVSARQAGDLEAHGYDEDYVRALEVGMPPAGGLGIGVDRLTMLFADRQSIRDVILFPLLRPERETGD